MMFLPSFASTSHAGIYCIIDAAIRFAEVLHAAYALVVYYCICLGYLDVHGTSFVTRLAACTCRGIAVYFEYPYQIEKSEKGTIGTCVLAPWAFNDERRQYCYSEYDISGITQRFIESSRKEVVVSLFEKLLANFTKPFLEASEGTNASANKRAEADG